MKTESRKSKRCLRRVLIAPAVLVAVTLVAPASTRAQNGGVASPTGTTYSVSHRLRLPVTAQNPAPACTSIPVSPTSVQPDDVVTFDGVPESLRTYIVGWTPTVDEVRVTESSSSFTITIVSTLPTGQDLFPGGFNDPEGNPFTDGCFTIGLDDPLDWIGIDSVLVAAFTAKADGNTVVEPFDVTSAFGAPWDGFANITLPGIAGQGVNRVELQFLVSKDVEAPPNDQCENASVLSGGGTVFSTVGADTDGPPEPLDCTKSGSDQIGSDIWYHHTATCTGSLTVDLCDAGFDTKVAVYEGCGACPTTRPVACNDDTDQCGPFGQGSRVSIPVTQGACFTVRLGGFLADQGTGIIRATCQTGACCVDGVCLADETEPSCVDAGGTWTANSNCATFECPPPPPENDECADGTEVFTDVPLVGSTEASTGTPDDSSCSSTDGLDVWHHWTATCDGRVTIDLCDSLFDTTLAVFDACEGGAELACNDDSCSPSNARVTIVASMGTTYFLRVAGSANSTGTYTLHVSDCSDPQGACCEPDGPFRCVPTTELTCIEFNGSFLGPDTVCLGDLNQNGRDDACEVCDAPVVVSADPPNCAIDARYPSLSDDALIRTGWDQIALTLDCEPGPLTPEDIALSAVPAGPALPAVTAVNVTGSDVVIDLSEPIPTQAWICVGIAGGDMSYCIAHLPGDTGGDGVAAAGDILDLIDDLNGVLEPALSMWQCDVDRSGACQPPDILGVIDLLNGAGAFEPWLNESLGAACPSAPF